jgi:hypothetical protein
MDIMKSLLWKPCNRLIGFWWDSGFCQYSASTLLVFMKLASTLILAFSFQKNYLVRITSDRLYTFHKHFQLHLDRILQLRQIHQILRVSLGEVNMNLGDSSMPNIKHAACFSDYMHVLKFNSKCCLDWGK